MFTGLIDIDMYIIELLDDYALINLHVINRYINQLCYRNQKIKNRIKYFKATDGRYTNNKTEYFDNMAYAEKLMIEIKDIDLCHDTQYRKGSELSTLGILLHIPKYRHYGLKFYTIHCHFVQELDKMGYWLVNLSTFKNKLECKSLVEKYTNEWKLFYNID